ncbi:hypothetical protein GCM10022254_09580 [Actinomadura meridiana]|uniref:TubC N-terminal docking domain-containing protein n=1 Tax=Actinomadura meridiana TaxID=559626 RepID=A0ABP8BU11_9ACTN
MTDQIVLNVVKRGAVLPVTRDALLEAGVIEPTPAERAEMDRAAAEHQRREAARAAQLAVVLEQLAALGDPLARAVLDLHTRDTFGECQGCDFGGGEGEPPEWPCRTVETVAAHHGIDLALDVRGD